MQRLRLKICLISDFSGYPDEGVRGVTFYFMKELSKYHEVKPIDLRTFPSPRFYREVKTFHPKILHFIPGPTIFSFVIMKTLKFYCPNSKNIMSAVHPNFYGFSSVPNGPSFALSQLFQNLIPLLKPDLLLVQSYEAEEMFKNWGYKIEYLPNGVNTEKFSPVSPRNKAKLREKYKVRKEKFIILHAGPIKKWRNIQILGKLQKENNQVIILGSTSLNMEKDVYQYLKQKGCLIWRKYFKDVRELYALSDCYVFPVVDKAGSIETPLSVLEAMACNLPVVSTKFGALPRVFEQGDGLIFAESEDEILQGIEIVKNGDLQIRTREKVLPYSWENIIRRLNEIYANVIFQPTED